VNFVQGDITVKNIRKEKKIKLPNVFPIHKGIELYCPDDKTMLVNTGWESHVDHGFFGSHKMGSEGFGFKCPLCHRTFYEAVTYYD
jgi:hypothetical protein